jgi:hypothetical protein
VIAAWLGHADAAFTMAMYAQSGRRAAGGGEQFRKECGRPEPVGASDRPRRLRDPEAVRRRDRDRQRKSRERKRQFVLSCDIL